MMYYLTTMYHISDVPAHTLLAYDRRMTLHAPPDSGCGHAHGGVSRFFFFESGFVFYLSSLSLGGLGSGV